MVLLLGGSGYVGQAFANELSRRGMPFRSVSRSEVDYTRFGVLVRFLEKEQPQFLINAAGSTGKPNVDACEYERSDTLLGNVVLPVVVSHACQVAGIPWGQVSSGCIYSGAWIRQQGAARIEPDLMRANVKTLVETEPDCVQGFAESDTPNFSFRHMPCGFYSGSKALAEEVLQREDSNSYIWRLRIPFDEQDHSRNYLSKLLNYKRLYENFNSITHRGDFARACLDLWEMNAAYGTYNITNPGFINTRDVVRMMVVKLSLDRDFEYWKNDEEFYQQAATAPRSNCVLDVSKVLAAGVKMRPVEEALNDALTHWRS